MIHVLQVILDVVFQGNPTNLSVIFDNNLVDYTNHMLRSQRYLVVATPDQVKYVIKIMNRHELNSLCSSEWSCEKSFQALQPALVMPESSSASTESQ